ncbi:MAG TPA: hypothetical protein PLT64_09945 [Syntrophales bacterium]|nr:hypothetical protein [Syntrophales bacterium]
MKVLLVTAFLPEKYNRNGPRQLLYSLLRKKPKDVLIDVILFDKDLVNGSDYKTDIFFESNYLGDTVNNLMIMNPIIVNNFNYLFSLRTSRYLFRNKIKIDYAKYNFIWLYPSWAYPDFRNCHSKILVTGMDCASLLFLRAVKNNWKFKVLYSTIMLMKSVLLEASVREGHVFHCVGIKDAEFFKKINKKAHILYAVHPFIFDYECKERKRDSRKKIVVGFSGEVNRFYYGNNYDRFFALMKVNKSLRDKIKLKFLGKDWHQFLLDLERSGFDCEWQPYVDRYEEFLGNIDIQIFLHTTGAGVKGKVVQALGYGCLVIGTDIAFDEVPSSCFKVVTSSCDEAANSLEWVVDNWVGFKDKLKNNETIIRNHFQEESCCNMFWNGVNRLFL